MGANCCVAAREKPLPSRVNHEVSTYRNFRHSPSWSFRWDNRTHIEDIVENHARFSHHNSGNVSSEVKSSTDTETDGPSDGDSPAKTFQPSKWRLSPGTGGSENTCTAADQSTARNASPEVKGSLKSSVLVDKPFIKTSVATPALSPSTIKMAGLSSPSRSIIPSNPSSKKIRHSPGHPLCGQVSDSRIPSLKSLNEGNSPEVGRNSHADSSDGLSMMHTFSELLSSSQRERWSFDSKKFSSFTNNLGVTPPTTHHSPDLLTCGICSKLLKEKKSPWSSDVVAVLICGHVYHSECLESLTSEIERYDPPCPICENKGESKGERPTALPISNSRKRNGKGAIMVSSSSMKSSISSSPFLKRRFSTGSRPVRSAPENETKKKSFWERYRRG
ncbi:hypothetical protein AXF42_Ash011372 [Apostasia shenzhenica]|uniref:RING-type domain-containing protein n=1 Tax=Apostasia shenzhenica TaxID=1088818 RepID=A0A2I0AEC0_9ASPA|nr:hypothetical protein AXF42_Ash011372 [Apostasia shenzhenica]